MILMASALALGGCVRILAFEATTPGTANARAALTAVEQSSYLRTHVGEGTVYRSTEEMIAREGLRGCLAGGGDFHLSEAEITDTGACGLNGDGRRQCLAWSDMSAIARPNDRIVAGYFPVRQPLNCAAS